MANTTMTTTQKITLVSSINLFCMSTKLCEVLFLGGTIFKTCYSLYLTESFISLLYCSVVLVVLLAVLDVFLTTI